jgi:hypothetical protein
MVEIPENPTNWTELIIKEILNSGFEESDILEFKSEINKDSDGIGKTVCAFANSKKGGTIIFGIDTNKKNIEEKIKGLEPTDNLKTNIVDQYKIMLPEIPLENQIFNEPPIKLNNGKIISILKILPSKLSPHQFKHKCYKRLHGGNMPMLIDEIKLMTIESARSNLGILLLMNENGLNKALIQNIIQTTRPEDFEKILSDIVSLRNSSSSSFLYGQGHLYEYQVAISVARIVENIDKLKASHILFETAKRFWLEDVKNNIISSVTPEQAMMDIIKQLSNNILEHISKLEEKLQRNVIPPSSIFEEL